MVFVSAILNLLVGLLVGGFAIYVGARIVLGKASYKHAVFTAAIGAVVMALVGILIPGRSSGSLVLLFAWIAVIKLRYSVKWKNSLLISLFAWLASVLTLFMLSEIGMPISGVIGLP